MLSGPDSDVEGRPVRGSAGAPGSPAPRAPVAGGQGGLSLSSPDGAARWRWRWAFTAGPAVLATLPHPAGPPPRCLGSRWRRPGGSSVSNTWPWPGSRPGCGAKNRGRTWSHYGRHPGPGGRRQPSLAGQDHSPPPPSTPPGNESRSARAGRRYRSPARSRGKPGGWACWDNPGPGVDQINRQPPTAPAGDPWPGGRPVDTPLARSGRCSPAGALGPCLAGRPGVAPQPDCSVALGCGLRPWARTPGGGPNLAADLFLPYPQAPDRPRTQPTGRGTKKNKPCLFSWPTRDHRVTSSFDGLAAWAVGGQPRRRPPPAQAKANGPSCLGTVRPVWAPPPTHFLVVSVWQPPCPALKERCGRAPRDEPRPGGSCLGRPLLSGGVVWFWVAPDPRCLAAWTFPKPPKTPVW